MYGSSFSSTPVKLTASVQRSWQRSDEMAVISYSSVSALSHRVLEAEIEKPMRRPGSHAQNTSSTLAPPTRLTVRVVPVPNGLALVHVTRRIAGTHLLYDGPSASVANSCSALTAISRSGVSRALAVETSSCSTFKTCIRCPLLECRVCSEPTDVNGG